MHLDVRGHPLHTRALSITLAQRADGRFDAQGTLLDLRKRGFVPVGGDLQPSGILHHMLLDAVVDPATAVLDAVRASQPTVAFEATAMTGGESCRDPVAAVEALAGAPLGDGSFGRRVSGALGGARGCTHLLTLAHLLGSTALRALERERALDTRASGRLPGQRIFRRDLVVDGHQTPDAALVLGLQLTDLHLAPTPAVARPMDRFAGQHEVRVLATVDLRSFTVTDARAAERTRDLATLAEARWHSRDAALAPLVGERLGPGITGTLVARFGNEPADRPLLDGLLMLVPTLLQCMAVLPEAWPQGAVHRPTLIGMGGLPDSCYMWRREGVLTRTREAEGAAPPPRPGT